MANILNDGIESDLNTKQRLFCQYYLEELNGRQSYKKAYGDGMTDESADVCASKLLRSAKVKKYINDLIDSYSSNVDVTIGEIVENIKSIAFDNKAKHSDRIKASELLGKYKNLFKEQIEITNTDITVRLED